jgi:hypothetical protein
MAGDSMADNDWTNFTINQDPGRRQKVGIILLPADLPNAATTTKISSGFKIRSTSPIELATNQSFAYGSLQLQHRAQNHLPCLSGPEPTTFG